MRLRVDPILLCILLALLVQLVTLFCAFVNSDIGLVAPPPVQYSSLTRTRALSSSSSSSFSSSKITCLYEDGPVEDRICHLQNVCWDRRESTFIFYQDPNNPIINSLTTASGEERKIPVRKYALAYYMYLPIKRVVGTIPQQSVAYSPHHNVYVYFESFWPENFAHALVDDIFPIYALTHKFGLTTKGALLLTQRFVDHLDADLRQAGAKRLDELSKVILGASIHRTSDHPLFRRYDNDDSAPRYTCVDHLVAGMGNFENYNEHAIHAGSWEPFYEHVVRTAGSSHAASNKTKTKNKTTHMHHQHLLVFIEKRGRRRILNMEALVEMARTTFQVETLVVDPSKIPFVEQVRLAQTATVTFSPCGGISFFNAFLQRGGMAIVLDFWDANVNASTSMDALFWRHVTTHETLRYPVHPDDIVIETPGNASHPGYWDYRNHGAVNVDLDRAQRLLYRALWSSTQTLGLGNGSFRKPPESGVNDMNDM